MEQLADKFWMLVLFTPISLANVSKQTFILILQVLEGGLWSVLSPSCSLTFILHFTTFSETDKLSQSKKQLQCPSSVLFHFHLAATVFTGFKICSFLRSIFSLVLAGACLVIFSSPPPPPHSPIPCCVLLMLQTPKVRWASIAHQWILIILLVAWEDSFCFSK